MAAGVPTIWLGLLKHAGEKNARFTHLKRTLIGGSAVPLAMIQTFEDKYGVDVLQGWGMTEMSPIGTIGTLLPSQRGLSKEERHAIKAKQGRAIYGVDLKIVGPDGSELPHDGVARGELLVRGPWIVSGYYNDPPASEAALTSDGWFRTGDVVTIDADGFVQIVDRAKDVIKSGGEWISSIDVENAAMGHPDVAEAAVIGLPHAKWGERPLIVIVPKEGRSPTKETILAFLGQHLAKWQLPDDVVFVKEIPHTATGKILKTKLREFYQGHKLPEAAA
jgi:fatty-acyl-CoA synthase